MKKNKKLLFLPVFEVKMLIRHLWLDIVFSIK